jgi:hypothetical protein
VNFVLTAYPLAPDGEQGTYLNYGGAEICLLDGSLLQSLAIDPNQHAVCDCGCAEDNCQAGVTPMSSTFNSATVNVQPKFMALLASNFCSAVPSQILASLTYDGVAQGWVTYTTTGHNAGDVYAIPLMVSSPVSGRGIYDWSVEVKSTVGTTVYDSTVSGSAPMVDNTSSHSAPSPSGTA